MNDKLKQSLDGRLGGMRWGARDQAEVFRQIQRKELQDVKHVKRGTGALAIAIALLFVVMGAAFALNQAPQPEDQRVAVQPTDTAILPISTALYENEYFTLTIDSSTCTASEAAFTGTIRMKNPADTMLSLASHTPPGDAGRTRLPVNLGCGVSTQLPGDMPMACGSLRELDVLNMTADTTVFRMSGEVASLHEDVTFTLWIDWTDPADSTAHSDKLTWSIAAPEQSGMLLAEYDLVTVTLADYSAEDGVASLALDVTPAKPWYVLNRQEESKATLTVSAEPLLLYPTFDPQDMLGMVDARDPIAGEMPVTLTQSPEGLRLVAEGPLPAAETLYGYVVLHVYSDAAEAHYDEGFDDHYYEVCVPVVPLVEAVEAAPTATPAPLPQPTATPAPPVRSEPTGEHIGGTDTVSVYLEESWYDGFSADVTLRIRADDAADKLAVTPNLGAFPSESTWVVRMEGSTDYYRSVITRALTLEPDTGDVLVQLTYEDLHNSERSNFSLPITLTVTNEKTWETETADISLWLEMSGTYKTQPLYLVSSSMDDLFVQGSLLTTDRCHYIGIMLIPDPASIPQGHLLDENGTEIAEGDYCRVNGKSLKNFPRPLFPYDGDDASQFNLIVMRVDKSVTLTDPLPIRLTKWTKNEGYTDLAAITLSTTTPAPSDAPQQVSIILDKNVLFDNEHVTVFFTEADYGYGHAFANVIATVKDSDRFSTTASVTEDRTYLNVKLTFTAYTDVLYQDGQVFTIADFISDGEQCSFFMHAYDEQWTGDHAPTIFARLTLGSGDNSIHEEYIAQFTFPSSGEVLLHSVTPVENAVFDDFEFVNGQLASTDYLSTLSITYRCTDPDKAPTVQLAVNGNVLIAKLNANYFPDGHDASLRLLTSHYTIPILDSGDSSYSLIVRDGVKPLRMGEFAVQFTPITN